MSFNPSIQDLANIVTTGVVIITVGILIWQVRNEIKEIEYDKYEKLMSDFSANTYALIEHPDVGEIVTAGNRRTKKWQTYTDAQKKAYFYFDSLVSLLERVYVGEHRDSQSLTERVYTIIYRKKRPDDWAGWKIWVEDLSTNDVFVEAFNNSKEMYSTAFATEIDSIIAKTATQRIKTSIPCAPVCQN
jgi:hypothetical protein